MKSLLAAISLLLFVLEVTAQDSIPPIPKSTFIKINPTTLINELDISFEQVISKKVSLEAGIIGVYTDYPDYVLLDRIDIGQNKPDISTHQYVDAVGLGVRAGIRWYIVPRNNTSSVLPSAGGTYFEPMLFYKRIFYPNENTRINNIDYKNAGDKDVYGLQLLIGRQVTHNRFVVDPYIGLGIRTKIYHYNTYHDNNGAPDLDHGRLVSILPSIQFGIKLGLKL
ncbi:hypothetical protein GA0116948_102362 [Chitinophaga costaii]|uniref:Outer membrane protein beta-barrel domain-containing protein n=1 Tax=Chitinophaga costaii TaxID=1335309 RepID=A0A1C4AZZ8_9BACT|nr:hypothetical protein [Chitinophaga costaii]PUZ26817.1 hypothetical protein DCM91_10500 [Chitinophaga costaii]SCC00144.1 hypothetical protein GA0116948_102362 [Chitinophaga costaii]